MDLIKYTIEWEEWMLFGRIEIHVAYLKPDCSAEVRKLADGKYYWKVQKESIDGIFAEGVVDTVDEGKKNCKEAYKEHLAEVKAKGIYSELEKIITEKEIESLIVDVFRDAKYGFGILRATTAKNIEYHFTKEFVQLFGADLNLHITYDNVEEVITESLTDFSRTILIKNIDFDVRVYIKYRES